MPTSTFNLKENQKAERRLVATYVDVSGSSMNSEWEWELLGAGIEDSAIEFNPDMATLTDILGITETTVNKFEEQQSFDPNTLRGGQKLNAILLDIALRRAYSELSNFNVMRAYQLLGTTSAIKAHIDKGCTITPQSLGGSSYVDMPIQVNFSGDRIHGTIDKMKNPTFTADTMGG